MVQRRRFLGTALGSLATGLVGCVTPHTDPPVRLFITIDGIGVVQGPDTVETTVRAGSSVKGGVGGDPAVREPRVAVYDAERSRLDSARLPVYESHETQTVITPPPETPTAGTQTTPGRTATPESTAAPANATPSGTVPPTRTPGTTYADFARPAPATVQVTTTTTPQLVSFEFTETRDHVEVDVAESAGEGPPPESVSTDGWEITAYEADERPF